MASSSQPIKQGKKRQVTQEEREAQLAALRDEAKLRFLDNKKKMQEIQQQSKNIEFQPIHLQNNFDYCSNFLPSECMIYIFSYLDIKTLCKTISYVCRGWCLLSRFDDNWKHLYFTHYPNVGAANNSSAIGDSFSCWFEAFAFRYELRKRWRELKCNVTYLDFMQSELKKHRGKNLSRVYNPSAALDQDEEKPIERYELSCMAHHNEKLAAADVNMRVVVWNLKTKQKIKELKGFHKDQISCVAMDGTRLVTAGGQYDREVIIFDAKQQFSKICTLNEQRSDADKQAQLANLTRYATMLKLVEDLLLVLFSDQTLELWDLKKLQRKALIKDKVDEVNNDPDEYIGESGQFIDFNKTHLVTFLQDRKLRVYNMKLPSVCIKCIDLNLSEEDRLKKKAPAAPAPAPAVTAAPPVGFGAAMNYMADATATGAAPATVAAPVTARSFVATCVQLMTLEEGCVGVAETEGDGNFLKFYDIKTGAEIVKKRIRLAYAHEPCTHTFFDMDKIVRVQHNAIVIHDRLNGLPVNTVQTPGNRFQYNTNAVLCDEVRLIAGVQSAGIVYYSFGKSNMYWADLEGGRKLSE